MSPTLTSTSTARAWPWRWRGLASAMEDYLELRAAAGMIQVEQQKPTKRRFWKIVKALLRPGPRRSCWPTNAAVKALPSFQVRRRRCNGCRLGEWWLWLQAMEAGSECSRISAFRFMYKKGQIHGFSLVFINLFFPPFFCIDGLFGEDCTILWVLFHFEISSSRVGLKIHTLFRIREVSV